MKIVFTESAWDDLTYWIENDNDQIKKIKEQQNLLRLRHERMISLQTNRV